MDSNTLDGYHHHHHHHHHQQQQQQQQANSGLLRFRSAPSSFLANLVVPTTCGAESEALISRFASGGDNNNNTASSSLQEFEDSKSSSDSKGLRRMNSQGSYGGGGGGVGLPPQYPRHGGSSSSGMGGSFGLMADSIGTEHEAAANRKGFGSNLVRQSSSPAGLFSNISFQNGFSNMKGVGSYGTVTGSNGELSPSINKLKNQISFSSRPASSFGMLSQISEIGSDEIGATSPDDGRQEGGNGDDAPHYGAGFPYGSWNDTPPLSENLIGLKRGRHTNQKLFSEVQNGELGNQVHMLSHHLSLPKTSSEMLGMEKLLQFPDSVPCKIRAKRGCATHPRSIAERVRRTRISERMRKLQELVPNMDKQTNTADMLDLAVEYIKNLQKEFKNLSEKRANCRCISMQKADTNQIS